jgi:hypothetical protein
MTWWGRFGGGGEGDLGEGAGARLGVNGDGGLLAGGRRGVAMGQPLDVADRR